MESGIDGVRAVGSHHFRGISTLDLGGVLPLLLLLFRASAGNFLGWTRLVPPITVYESVPRKSDRSGIPDLGGLCGVLFTRTLHRAVLLQ